MSSIAETIAALQARNASITGVRNAPTAYPSTVPSANLPLALVFPGPQQAGWRAHQGDSIEEQRIYIVRCYVTPISQGQGVDEGMQQAIALLDAFVASYLNDIELGPGLLIDVAGRDLRDSGVRGDLLYRDVQYRGFELQVPVQRWTYREEP